MKTQQKPVIAILVPQDNPIQVNGCSPRIQENASPWYATPQTKGIHRLTLLSSTPLPPTTNTQSGANATQAKHHRFVGASVKPIKTPLIRAMKRGGNDLRGILWKIVFKKNV